MDDLILSDFGEKEIIRKIIRQLPLINNTPLPLNDDAQIIPSISNGEFVISTDRTPTDLRALEWGLMSYRQYGKYCVVSNLSDIAAMGAKAVGFLLNIGANSNLRVSVFKEVLLGVTDALNEYQVPLLGGDTKEAKELNLVGVSIGQLPNKYSLKRTGANIGDYVVLSPGALGLASAAQYYFKNSKLQDCKIDSELELPLINALVDVRACFEESDFLYESGFCTACMDNTDGLLISVQEIAEASGVGIELNLDKVDIHPSIYAISSLFNINPLTLLLSGGGDFKLVTTLSQLPDPILGYTVIGLVSDNSCNVAVHGLSKEETDSISGWVHFR